jgi:glycosyltransferase A (GT-A) superfamily protein (DUF2064 family)
VAIAVLAKEPRPGFSKTRMCPPFSPAEAAALAEAMLRDTLGVVAGCPAARRIVVLDGSPGGWLPAGFEVIPQRGGDQAERIGAAFEDIGGPALLIGMDTPQVTEGLLHEAAGALCMPGTDAVLGATPDGGWWAGGLRKPNVAAFQGVPMSRSDTVDHQRSRFASLGLNWREVRQLTDVDDFSTALAVAELIPASRFARRLKRSVLELSERTR